ncbi:flavodoxin domain-containing protein [Streptomyces sp. NPDC003487]
MDVLVGYATAHGSTREIAERLAAGLRGAGLTAQARAVSEVDDAGGYRAFVIGSAVHGQAWLASVRAFLADNAGLIAARPVWIFSVGMPAALRGPWRRLGPREGPAIVGSLPVTVRGREHRLFSGVIAPEALSRPGRLLFRLMGGRFGDHRDWNAIDAWAADIATALRERFPLRAGRPSG